ncbi:hypothetical protein NHX12_007814, partial [Muraenolepis orangiensis]
ARRCHLSPHDKLMWSHVKLTELTGTASHQCQWQPLYPVKPCVAAPLPSEALCGSPSTQ